LLTLVQGIRDSLSAPCISPLRSRLSRPPPADKRPAFGAKANISIG
jgi:hypothetical protein